MTPPPGVEMKVVHVMIRTFEDQPPTLVVRPTHTVNLGAPTPPSASLFSKAGGTDALSVEMALKRYRN